MLCHKYCYHNLYMYQAVIKLFLLSFRDVFTSNLIKPQDDKSAICIKVNILKGLVPASCSINQSILPKGHFFLPTSVSPRKKSRKILFSIFVFFHFCLNVIISKNHTRSQLVKHTKKQSYNAAVTTRPSRLAPNAPIVGNFNHLAI